MIRARRLKILIAVAGAVLLAATHTVCLTALGNALIHAEPAVHADMAVVLAGDYYGLRILKAGELIRQGYVPQALVSGPSGFYGNYECDLAIAFAVKRGYPEQGFIRCPMDANSTVEEAARILPELRKRNVHRFLLVTSDYHTARAGRVYRARGRGFEIHVVAAPDLYFRADSWWHNREGRKTFYMEWSKTIASFLGL